MDYRVLIGGKWVSVEVLSEENGIARVRSIKSGAVIQVNSESIKREKSLLRMLIEADRLHI